MADYYKAITVLFTIFDYSFLSISGQTNYNQQLCSPDNIPITKSCSYANDEILVPLPHDCPNFQVNAKCTSGVNHKIPLDSESISFNVNNRTWSCHRQSDSNLISTLDSSLLLRIEMIQVEKIYAIYIDTGYSISSVEVLRNLLNNTHVKSQCLPISRGSDDHEQFKQQFYCYKNDDIIISYESVGFDASAIEIRFAHGIHPPNPCEFQKKIKLFSYPMRLCGTPGSYEDQIFKPKLDFYLPGQMISYKCFSTSSTGYVGVNNNVRQCQENGTWSGRAPICISGPSHYPESYHATRKTDKNVHNMSVADCFNIFNGSKHTEYPITGAQISLNQSGCTMFNLKESYKAERVEIVFRYGDKHGVEVYYVEGHQFIPLKKMKNVTVTGSGQSRRQTNWYISSSHSNQSFPLSFSAKQLIILGSAKSGDDNIYNLTVYKSHDTEGLKEKKCPSVDSIPNAKWNSDRTNSTGNIGNWSCDRGYYEESNSTLSSCNEGILIGTPPNCKKRYCDSTSISAENVLSNIVNRYKNKLVTVNSTLIFQCNEGFFINESSKAITCQENGQWNSSKVNCINMTELLHQDNLKATSANDIIIGGVVGGIALMTGLGYCYFRKRKIQDKAKKTDGHAQHLEVDGVVSYVNVRDCSPAESVVQGAIKEEPGIYANVTDKTVEEDEVCYCELSFHPNGIKQTKPLDQSSNDEDQTIYATIAEPNGLKEFPLNQPLDANQAIYATVVKPRK